MLWGGEEVREGREGREDGFGEDCHCSDFAWWVDGWFGWMDGWVDGWVDGWKIDKISISFFFFFFLL